MLRFEAYVFVDYNFIMHENAVSYRMKQQNLLKSKVQIFQSNYEEARQRMSSTSSMTVLAGSVYAHKQNKLMTPKKALKRPLSASMLAKVSENPQLLKSPALKGLNTRASHIANYSDINTQLLMQRKNLEEHILFLKDQILKQKKLKNRAEMNIKKNHNQIEHSRNQIKELDVKSSRLNQAINETRQDMLDNKRQLNDRINDNAQKNANIQLELRYINELENRCKQLKNQTLIEEKNRTNTKAELIKQQKVMAADSILMRELEQERANLLLQINRNVERYKLE